MKKTIFSSCDDDTVRINISNIPEIKKIIFGMMKKIKEKDNAYSKCHFCGKSLYCDPFDYFIDTGEMYEDFLYYDGQPLICKKCGVVKIISDDYSPKNLEKPEEFCFYTNEDRDIYLDLIPFLMKYIDKNSMKSIFFINEQDKTMILKSEEWVEFYLK